MSVSERKFKHDLQLAQYYYKNRNTDLSFLDKSISIIKTCYKPFTENLQETLKSVSLDNIIELAEVAFTVSLPDISDKLITVYFEQDQSSKINQNNFYIRAHLVKALVESKVVPDKNLKAEDAAKALVKAVSNIQKALDIIAKPENKVKYASIVYNASITTFNILKRYLKLNWSKNFWEIFEKLSAMLEENDDVDFNWRIFVLIKLAQCYIDADKKAEAGKALDKIADVLKRKGDCNFMEELYKTRIHLSRDNNGALGNLKKEGESNTTYPQFKYLYTVQAIRSNIITDKDIDKEVNGLITAICPDFLKNIDTQTGKYQSDIPLKIEAWKADVLAELAYVLLKFKSMQNICINIYDFLSKNGSNSLKGKVHLENLHSQKVLIDMERWLKDNAQPTHIIRQKRIDAIIEALQVLDRNMAGCARLQDYDLINETSMIIFNTAIPLFKRSLRKHFYKAFYTACDQLEQIESNESLLRASMHYELTKYYLEEDLIQEANTNLMKALDNDYSIPLSKLGAGAASSQGNKKAATTAQGKGADASKATGDTSLTNSTSNNVAYSQRTLEQYLVYLKRSIGVRVNIYSDPDNVIDQLILEYDNIKHSKNKNIQNDTINKCVQMIETFTFDEFALPESTRDFVEEEINEFKTQHELKLYDDKKHFILIAADISKLCYELDQYEQVFKIDNVISKFTDELHTQRDVDQLIALAETKIEVAKSYSEYLFEDALEICGNDYKSFEDETRVYTDIEKEKIDTWRTNVYNALIDALKISTNINQHWLTFQIGIQLWNFIHPLLTAPNYIEMFNDGVLTVLTELFEAMNNAMIYYESINAEVTDTDFFTKKALFAYTAEVYGKLLEFKSKTDECIRVCDVMLARNLESKYRKIFDTLKAKASKLPSDPNAKKKAPAQPKAPTTKKGDNTGAFIPSQDMTVISDCFANLETAVNTADDKTKVELLKKGVDMLKTYKVNYNDENTVELHSELWYKYGVRFYEVNEHLCYKHALQCADNCTKSYDNIDIKKNNIGLQLQKWYCLGFLLYGDCLLKLVDPTKQERLSQIKMYFSALDKVLTSAKIAEKAKQYSVILQNMKAFYSIVINLIDQPKNRETLCTKFLTLHQILINNKSGASVLYTDAEYLLLFYSLFCNCINETTKWELGEKIVSEAMKIIPNQFQHVLLEHKLFYYSKQGKSFLQNLTAGPTGSAGSSGGAGNDKEVLTKAKLFSKLARSSPHKADQFDAYMKAIEMLKADNNIYVCNVILELCAWLYKNNYPFADIEDHLNNAADIILEIDSLFEDEEDLEDEGATLHSKRSTSSRKSRLSKRTRSKRSNATQSKRKTVTNAAGRSKASERSRTRNYSSRTSKTKTIFAKMLDYDPYPLYMNINHMEQLFKIEVFLSIVSVDYTKRQEYLLDAFYVLKKIIEMSMKTMNCIEFYESNKDEIERMNFTGTDVNPLTSLINNYYIAKDLNIPQQHALPDTLDGWLTFDWPEALVKRVEFENAIVDAKETISTANVSIPNYTLICKKSFETPYQFYYYFNYMLDKFMNDYYFHSECFLMLKFGMFYAKHILCNRSIEYAYTLIYSKLVNNVVIHNNDNNVSTSIYDNLHSLLTNNTEDNAIPKLTEELIQKERDNLRRFDIALNTDTNETHFVPKANGVGGCDDVIRYVDDLLPYIGWIEIAKAYYDTGYFNYCKEFASESIFHSLVMKDKASFMKANMLLARVYFVEGNFDACNKLFTKVQTINQCPNTMFDVIKHMTNIFESMNKHEEMNVYLETACDYFEQDYQGNIKTNQYTSSTSLFYQMYSYCIINRLRALVRKFTESLRLNDASSLLTCATSNNSVTFVISFYKEKVFPLISKFKELTSKSSYTLHNILAVFSFVSATLTCLTKNALFTYVTKEELEIICTILEKCLNMLEDVSAYLSNLQTFVPLRLDSNLISLPIHRLMASAKILYATLNNTIGEFKNRIKRESQHSTKLSLNDKDIHTKFAEGVKYNQEVIDYLNGLTKQINKMANKEERDNIEHMNRYEKSLSLLASCESLIPKVSSEYILFIIEKISSLRLQALHFKELKHLWSKDVLDEVTALTSQSDVEPENQTQKTQQSAKPSKLHIKKFHQMTINLISEFEKNIISNTSYEHILIRHYQALMKYYYCVIETTGYFNIELAFKALTDYQNNGVKLYFNDVIHKYVNPKSRDWSSFALHKQACTSFSFDSPFRDIYTSVSYNESIKNYETFINDIPYYKNANTNAYTQWSEVKNILPNNSSYFIMQLNDDRSIMYIGYMTVLGAERKVNYYLKRIVMNNDNNKRLDEFVQVIKSTKQTLIKSVIATKEELTKAFEEHNEKIAQVVDSIEKMEMFTDIFNDLNDIINPNLELLEQQQLEKEKELNAKGKKPAAPAAPKKGDKNAGMNVDITLPTSNIEQITFLIDSRFNDLPWDALYLFSKIPYKSNDFSLNTHVMRLKAVNFAPQSMNTVSLPGNVKYYLDYFQEQQMKYDIKNSINTVLGGTTGGKNNPVTSPIEGVVSYERRPSVAEIQKLYMNANIFIFTSQTALLYQLPYDIFDTSRYAKCKVALVLDRICNIKNYIDQASLIPQTFSFNYQPQDTIAMMTLCGVCSIMTSRWSMEYDEVSELMKNVLEDGVAKGYCTSYAINKYTEPKRVAIQKEGEEVAEDERTASAKGKGVTTTKGSAQGKKKEEAVVLDDTNSVEVRKMKIFTLAPVVYGLNNVKLI